MTRRLDRKVPGGKLLRAELELEGGSVLRVRVRGDFFAHPEEAFEAAEAELSGVPAATLAAAALAAFSRPGLGIHGASAADIADLLRDALGDAASDTAGDAPGGTGAGRTP